MLSLLDWRYEWIDPGRKSLPVIPSTSDLLAQRAAIKRVDTEGLDVTISRHRAASAAARAGLHALGLEPWVERDGEAAHVATTVRRSRNRSAEEVRHLIDPMRVPSIFLGVGPLADELLRINHTGRGANPKVVTDALEDLSTIALGRRPCSGGDATPPRAAQSPEP